MDISEETLSEELKILIDADMLSGSYDLACKGTDWKESVQRFGMTRLFNIYYIIKDIVKGVYKEMEMPGFILHERGRVRFIQPHNIRDRVVQRNLCDNILMPVVVPKLIYDNGASLEGKGISFSRRRFEEFCRKAKRRCGDNCYILFLDCSKYFDNLMHELLLEQFSSLVSPQCLEFIRMRLKEYEVDVSYMSNLEFQYAMDDIFNSLDYIHIPKKLRTGDKMLRKSVGIGSQLSQICGIIYANPIDQYCKTVMQLPFYERYMDDTAIILDSKEKLCNICDDLTKQYKKRGITVNQKKTRIVSLNDRFVYLKTNYFFKGDKLIRKMMHETLTRERQRLRSYRRLIEKDRMTLLDVDVCYGGWRGMYKHYDSGYQLLKMDKYYRKVFSDINN